MNLAHRQKIEQIVSNEGKLLALTSQLNEQGLLFPWL